MAIITIKRRKKLEPKKFGLPVKDKKKIDRKADNILGQSAFASKKASSKKSPIKRKSI